MQPMCLVTFSDTMRMRYYEGDPALYGGPCVAPVSELAGKKIKRREFGTAPGGAALL